MDLKKELGGVADAVTKIMDEALKGNQHKIDANKNGKVDAHDFKLLRAKKEVKEESEQIDELSKKTLGNYITRNADDQARIGFINSAAHHDKTTDNKTKNKILDRNERQGINRDIGLTRAVNKLTKEEIDQVEERSLTEPEMEKKEEIVKSMKKGLSGFKDRYGKDAKSVMYATATKQAKGD